ncbi:MAG TPA: tol-pal system protein YbgF [Gallionellaceae bacterium]
MQVRALLLLTACLVAGQAHAGLLSDDEARKQIKTLEGRINQQEDTLKQRTQTIIDLQTQLQALNEEVRKLQGRSEELQHALQDAEKRQKDFYVDLDSRLRRIEAGAPQSGQPSSAVVPDTAANATAPIDPVAENRDFDAAFALFKSNKLQASITAFLDFLNKYPGSTLAPNAYYRMGGAYYSLKDYKNAVNSYLTAASKFPSSGMAPNALLGAAICYQELGEVENAKKTLKQIIMNYPDNPITPRAKKRLDSLK